MRSISVSTWSMSDLFLLILTFSIISSGDAVYGDGCNANDWCGAWKLTCTDGTCQCLHDMYYDGTTCQKGISWDYKPVEGIVSNPVTIGQPMTVTCSMAAVGGLGVFKDHKGSFLDSRKIVNVVAMRRKRPDQSAHSVLASLFCKGQPKIRYNITLPPGINRNNFKMSGCQNGDKSMVNNAEKVQLSMTVNAQTTDVLMYTCEFVYEPGSYFDANNKTKIFDGSRRFVQSAILVVGQGEECGNVTKCGAGMECRNHRCISFEHFSTGAELFSHASLVELLIGAILTWAVGRVASGHGQ